MQGRGYTGAGAGEGETEGPRLQAGTSLTQPADSGGTEKVTEGKLCHFCQSLGLLSGRFMQNCLLPNKERDSLEEEKQRQVKSGAAGAVLHHALERENGWLQRATDTLRDLEGQLVERQSAYCSLIRPRDQRLEMEKNMLLKVIKQPIGGELDLETDLKDIFKRDKHCADPLNMDKRKNGSLMWVYLKYWQLQVTLQKHKRAEEAVLGGKIPSHTE